MEKVLTLPSHTELEDFQIKKYAMFYVILALHFK